ncbi:MAG: hypothetical protein NTW21_03580 [Verrucomicrobia bacterium]|nr:hypothetical protein [Verrucomicrobiota bacterium]
MNTATDTRIENFRQTVERADTLQAQLDTLAITVARADELPGLLQGSGDGMEARWLREEQAAIGHPLALRIRHAQLDAELRQIRLGVGEQLRAALDAAAELVTAAAGGADGAMASPFVQRHLAVLARNRSGPTLPSTPESRLAHLLTAWRDIDTAMASLGEIRFDVRQRNSAS